MALSYDNTHTHNQQQQQKRATPHTFSSRLVMNASGSLSSHTTANTEIPEKPDDNLLWLTPALLDSVDGELIIRETNLSAPVIANREM